MPGTLAEKRLGERFAKVFAKSLKVNFAWRPQGILRMGLTLKVAVAQQYGDDIVVLPETHGQVESTLGWTALLWAQKCCCVSDSPLFLALKVIVILRPLSFKIGLPVVHGA